jgi:hypothetical protein
MPDTTEHTYRAMTAKFNAEKAHRMVLVAFDLLENANSYLSELPAEMDNGTAELLIEMIDEHQAKIRTRLDQTMRLAGCAT